MEAAFRLRSAYKKSGFSARRAYAPKMENTGSKWAVCPTDYGFSITQPLEM